MKKINHFLFTCFFMLVISSSGYPQSVDELIDNYAEAMGGADKLLSIQTLKLTGNYSGNGLEIPMVTIVKRDGKARMDLTYQGMNMTRACDQNTGWMINPLQGNKEADKLPAEEVKEMKKRAEIEGELINYKKKGYKAELLGKDDFEGTEVYKIRITDKDGDKTYYFMDVSTYLILKDNAKRKVGEKEILSETLYGNYQKTDGVMFPMSIEFKEVGDNQGQKVTIEKVETNVSVDDSFFKMPTSK